MKILWSRLLTNPTTRVESQEGELTRLKVEGLVCDKVCAVRTKSALESIEGVERADVDLETGIATIKGRPVDADAYESAVSGVVTFRPIRRAIEAVARFFGRGPARGASPA